MICGGNIKVDNPRVKCTHRHHVGSSLLVIFSLALSSSFHSTTARWVASSCIFTFASQLFPYIIFQHTFNLSLLLFVVDSNLHMLSEVVCELRSPTIPRQVSVPHQTTKPVVVHSSMFNCSAAAYMASNSNNSTSSSSSPTSTTTTTTTANQQSQHHHHHHNPNLGTTGPSMSLPDGHQPHPNSVGKPKRSKLRPHLSLRIALTQNQQAGSAVKSPGYMAAGSFDGCLPLSPSFQQHMLQKSEPLLSASALDELQPVEILPKLYIGTMKSASDRSLLERLNIGYVINVTTNLPNFYPSSFQYLRIPLEDHWSGEISGYVDEAFEFISKPPHLKKETP